MLQKYSLLVAVWEHNRIRISVIIVLLLCVFGAYMTHKLVVEPNLLTLRTEKSKLQQHVREQQVKSASSDSNISKAEQTKKNLEQFDLMMPRQEDFSLFLGELFDWANRVGLEIHQINFQPTKEKETGFLRYGLSFSVKGSYAQIKQFINLLENAKRILLVEKIALSGTPTKDKVGREVNLNIELAAYFKGESL